MRSSGACEETIGGISRARSAWEWQEDKGVRQRPALDITAITDSRNPKISSTPSPVGCPRLSFGKAKKIEREIEGACSYKRTYLGEMHLPRHAAQLVIPRGACHASRLDRYRYSRQLESWSRVWSLFPDYVLPEKNCKVKESIFCSSLTTLFWQDRQ